MASEAAPILSDQITTGFLTGHMSSFKSDETQVSSEAKSATARYSDSVLECDTTL